MCGLTGFLDLDARHSTEDLRARVWAMTETIRHRGPDGGDVWVDAAAGIALGHRRLAIVDLSEAGHQPMASSCGRFVVAYNGEAYNADDLRPELEAAGRRFRGHSDTEVIVEGCAVWGIRATIERLVGMFAIAIWDRRDRRLTLVRDRLGIKPLYWARFGAVFAFGSELKTLRALPDWTPEIDRGAVAAYMRHTYVPAPWTIYRGVSKLEAGKILTIEADGTTQQDTFWSVEGAVRAAAADKGVMSDAEAEDALHDVLFDAVQRRMVADVPLGAFLSGGIDSSTVAALMQAASDRPVKTFSIGFKEVGYNEAEHAKAVAKHIGTDHTELYAEPEHALNLIPRLADMYDEPFADSSQIPTYLVSEMTRRHVTVALSGDGGDELFAGYNRYLWADRFYRLSGRVPGVVRRLGAGVLSAVPESCLGLGLRLKGDARSPALMKDRLLKIARILPENDPDGIYRKLLTHWDGVVKDAVEPKGVIWDSRLKTYLPDFMERMQAMDMLTYLPDDILTKVDRASMAVALEVRVPIIDHRVVELSWKLRRDQKLKNGQGKNVLRNILYRYVPRDLVERPKTGFSMPVAEWLRGPLKDWAADLLDEQRLSDEGFFDVAHIQRAWAEHQSGRRNWQYHLWAVVMFQAWKTRWMG
ncbi:MAG: asparagine synthase (glutamine-hydrolyzing) [Rhodospirillaceae bacterium]|nr:asparagine synthase (glutamine-hydrolyzing) [Rhodospirillaceae bacterium]